MTKNRNIAEGDYTAAAAAPSTPSIGNRWFDTVNEYVLTYTGSEWAELGSHDKSSLGLIWDGGIANSVFRSSVNAGGI